MNRPWRHRSRSCRVLRGILCVPGLALTGTSVGQWTEANLPIADRSGEQVQPKLVATPDGGFYVSWFDNNAGGYDVYLQRLDAGGNEQWPHNGVLVADRGFGSTQDYGLAIDAAGHALLAFRDDRFGGVQITAARVDPAGTLDWGADGVQLTADGVFHAAPGIAGTTDGGIVVAWTNDTDVKVQRLDAAGTPQWGSGVVLSDPAADYAFSDLHGGDDGSVILSWVRSVTFSAPKHIYTQKLDATGAAQWNRGAPVAVFDGGSLQFGNFPDFVPDGGGGAVFGWYSTSPLQCFAQHVRADGTEAFPHNGSAGAIAGALDRVSPSVAYNPATDEVFLFWTEQAGGQFGVSGQKFDSAGARQWTDAGSVVATLEGVERTFANATMLADGAIVAYLEGGFGAKSVRAARVAGDGSLAWTPAVITASNAVSGKGRLTMRRSAGGTPVLAWQDERTDANDVYGQHLNADGTLGDAGCPPDLDGSGDVGFTDLLQILSVWGPCPGCPQDLDRSGDVGFTDLLQVLSAWGPCV